MKIIIILVSLLMSSFARAQGSMGGNGGGIVQCEGGAPLTLDYYEALEGASGDASKLLPVEQWSREKFFEVVFERIQLSELRKKQVWIYESYFPSLSASFKSAKTWVKQSDQWIPSAHWNIHDEALHPLPQGCHFSQAAFTDQNGTHQIIDAVQSLSSGQKHVLELHEILYSMQMGRTWRGFIATSTATRNFVHILLKKNPSYAELRLAYYQFMNPLDTFEWKNGDLNRVDVGMNTNPFYSSIGVWALDLRTVPAENKPLYDECPRWQIISPTSPTESYLQKIWELKDSSLRIENSWLNHDSHPFSESCPYVSLTEISNSHSNSEVRNRDQVKTVLQYFEEKLNRIPESNPDLMSKIRSSLNW